MLQGLRNRLLGDRGERIAERALRKAGVRILHRQCRTRCGEIDLIGRDADGRYVFCEVKTRTAEAGAAPRFGRPAEAVTAAKQRQITRSALAYLKAEGLLETASCRFDVVEVVTPADGGEPTVTHLPHAFDASGVASMFS
ncbi:YraN family protein [Alienimonas chondri]|uniref:UPF0102 protein LzC2_31620 n=1 Tax=Alienimonas chondri TaxID=2681879 RepID=A0ABX1VHT9_9PLAN|nr:YraN family protein [Alienimonas chondri]NNJ27065.1 hypothetical protein [Alienimonas chondri]